MQDESRISTFSFVRSFTVPKDFIELLGECNRFTSGDWRYVGTQSRKIPFETEDGSGDLILLYENDPFSLCVKVASTQPEVFLYNQIDEELANIAESFVDALRVISVNPPEQ